MSSFADDVAVSLGPRLHLPPELRLTFDWMEANRFVHRYKSRDARYASLYPAALEGVVRSSIAFHVADRSEALLWTRGDAAGADRLASILRTGGDGSKIGLWLNDQGQQKFVHMGSGSGSVLLCEVTDNPVDILRLLAIGYDEVCWPEHYGLTVEQALEEDDFAEEFVAPAAFRAFVEATFNVTIPTTASQIITSIAEMDDPTSSDPFWNWIKSFDR